METPQLRNLGTGLWKGSETKRATTEPVRQFRWEGETAECQQECGRLRPGSQVSHGDKDSGKGGKPLCYTVAKHVRFVLSLRLETMSQA